MIRFSPSGTIEDVWADLGQFTYPHGIAVDASGAIYTAESGDVWSRTGDLAGSHATLLPRAGAEGSALRKSVVVTGP